MKSHNNHEDRWSIHVPDQNKEESIYSLLYEFFTKLIVGIIFLATL